MLPFLHTFNVLMDTAASALRARLRSARAQRALSAPLSHIICRGLEHSSYGKTAQAAIESQDTRAPDAVRGDSGRVTRPELAKGGTGFMRCTGVIGHISAVPSSSTLPEQLRLTLFNVTRFLPGETNLESNKVDIAKSRHHWIGMSSLNGGKLDPLEN